MIQYHPILTLMKGRIIETAERYTREMNVFVSEFMKVENCSHQEAVNTFMLLKMAEIFELGRLTIS